MADANSPQVSDSNPVREWVAAPRSRRDVLRAGGKAAVAIGAGGGVSALAAACAPAAAPGSAAPASQAPGGSPAASASGSITPTIVKFQSWFWWEPGRQDAWRTMVKKFHEAQNAVRIEEAGWPAEQFFSNILVQLQSGQMDGDLIGSTPDLFLRLLKANQLEPLDDVTSKIGIDTSPGRDPKAPLSLSLAHDSLKKDGHLYGLDQVTVGFGLLYNPKLYDKAGISGTPTSIDEWIDVTTKLTDRPNQFGIYSPHLLSQEFSFWFITQAWIFAYDGIWAQGKTPMVTSEPVINTLKLFKKMYEVGMPQGSDDPTAIRLFVDNKLAQWFIVSAAVNVLKSEGPEIYPIVRSAPPPWPSRKAMTRIHPIVVNAKSEKKEAAKVFLEWLFQPENYQQLLELSLDVIPAYPAGIRQEYLDSLPWTAGYTAAVPVTPPEVMGDFIFNNDEFGKIVVTNFQQSLTGTKPIEESMAAAQKELEELAQRI